MKAEILKILRQSQGVVSGNLLCSRLGTSRVAVWKHIQTLQKMGYEIDSSTKGYRLRSAPDCLHPWEFPGREERIHYYPEAPSTMDLAKELARKGCPGFTTVVAGCQTRGRGRLRRVWSSEEGGLYFTVVLRPRLPVLHSWRANFLAALTLGAVLREDYGIDAGLKWPNDILVGGSKLCGMLAEMEAEGEQVNFVNIGIGINVNNNPPPMDPPAVSLKALLGRPVARRDILARFLDEIESRVEKANWGTVISQWKERSVTLNRQVRIVTTQEEISGLAVDVDENGALMLRKPDGSIATVIFGDCFLN